MNSKFLIIAVAVTCLVVGWKSKAQTETQAQSTIVGGPGVVATEADIQLLRQDLRAQKQKLIAQNLPMTESEAVKFWAVYNRYTGELRDINDEKFRLTKEYAEKWGAMTNEDALIYIRRWLEVDAQTHQLRLKYVPEMSQVLPGKKAATFFQLDRRISMMMDIQLASQIPLADARGNQ